MAASKEALGLTVKAETRNGALTIAASGETCLGVEIQFSQHHSAEAFSVDADVWSRRGNSLFVSLNRPVTLTAGTNQTAPHLTQVNLPAEITVGANGAEIAFSEDGMLQAVVEGKGRGRHPRLGDRVPRRQDYLYQIRRGGHSVPSLQRGDRSMNAAVCMLDEAAAQYGSRVALEDETEVLTYAQYRGRARSIATALWNRGSGRKPIIMYLPRARPWSAPLWGPVRGQSLCAGGFSYFPWPGSRRSSRASTPASSSPTASWPEIWRESTCWGPRWP